MIDGIARKNRIPLVGLGTIIEHVTILDGLSRDTERDLLIATLRQSDHLDDIAETVITRYQQGDILLAWMRSPDRFVQQVMEAAEILWPSDDRRSAGKVEPKPPG